MDRKFSEVPALSIGVAMRTSVGMVSIEFLMKKIICCRVSRETILGVGMLFSNFYVDRS